MSYLISWLSGIIISVILTSVLTVILRDEIQRLVSEKLGPYVSSDDRSISGIWEVVYLYCSEGEVKSEKHIILLNQIGSHVVGKNLTSEKHKHRLTGKLDQEKFYTGRWDNLGSDLYYGAFQFFVKPDGREMNGLWIGFDSSNTIRKGYWK
ncbi:hypothetical protein GGP81_002098 [Salinibacter ruber]|uniref:hypothetical protein n=1 Tax=Salinibacter ruber TaxID=146919 RepID=UPI0021674088|nr:hypothetical protein [Salinibacter ruber]MCS3955567.1 hypothetical protein [Salinibacter ruber]